MVKSNKKIIGILMFCVFSFNVSAQTTMKGMWKITGIIGVTNEDKYKIVTQNKISLGNNLTLNQDGTFSCFSLHECGNDCFVRSSGNFIEIDGNYIRFILKDLSYSGFCTKNESLKDQNKDLGIFYIHKIPNAIELIKSSGVLEDDKNKVLYDDLMDSFNWNSYDFVWNGTRGNNQEQVLKDCIDYRNKSNFSNSKIVLSKKESYGEIILVQQNDDFHFLIYDDFHQKISLAYPKK